jgi:uncharacterized membrane protein
MAQKTNSKLYIFIIFSTIAAVLSYYYYFYDKKKINNLNKDEL